MLALNIPKKAIECSNSGRSIRLTAQIQLRTTPELHQACHLAKNLYNAGNYLVRQTFLKSAPDHRIWLRYQHICEKIKSGLDYKALPAQCAQQTLRVLDKNWTSFFRSIKDWKAHPGKYKGRPRLPKYLKKDGETVLFFTNQIVKLENNTIYFPKRINLTPIRIPRYISIFHQIRIIPHKTWFMLEIVYSVPIRDSGLDSSRALAIDIGVNNLLTIVNNVGLSPMLIQGRVVKSRNQFYNKRRSQLQSKINKADIWTETKQLNILTRKRLNFIKDYFHKSSRSVIDFCMEHNIGTIIIGKNDGWKQQVNMGGRNNQIFVYIPFEMLIQMIIYKAALVGITVCEGTEEYTSKCSAVDKESIKKHDSYLGRRVKRGLFRTANGIELNADVNAGFNIGRKIKPKLFEHVSPDQMILKPIVVEILLNVVGY